MGYPRDEITTEERIKRLDNFGGYVRNDTVDDGHRALPNNRAQYVTNHSSVEWVDSRMTGWGYDDDLATECLYNNVKSILWNMVKEVE